MKKLGHRVEFEILLASQKAAFNEIYETKSDDYKE